MKMFTFSEQKFHLLHSKAQQRSWWCSVQPWFWLFRSLGWLLSLAEKTLFLSLPAGPPRLLVMHILYLGCGCIDLLGHCCCTCLGASENVLVGVGLMLPADLLSAHCLCEHPAICVSTGDPQRPPWSLAKSPACGRDSGNFCRLKKSLLVLMSWVGLRIQTLSSTFAKRSSL